MDRMAYTQAAATMRVYEKRLLDKVRQDRMVDAPTPEEALRILSETEYSRHMSLAKRPEEFEVLLLAEQERVYKEIRQLMKDPELFRILSLKYDYQNLKILVKLEALKSEQSPVLNDMGAVKGQELKSLFDQDRLKDVSPVMAQAVKVARDDFSKNYDPQRLDFILDKAYFKELKDLSSNLNEVDLISNYVATQIDSYNLLAFLRSKKQGREARDIDEFLVEGGQIGPKELLGAIADTPETLVSRFSGRNVGPALKKGLEHYGETKSLADLERALQNRLVQVVTPAKQVVFGPEPLFGYLVAKEREIANIRMIMVSKINNIPADRIRERLRDLYA